MNEREIGGRSSKISFGEQVKEKMVNQSNHLKDEVDACLSVMVELMTLLGVIFFLFVPLFLSPL